MVRLSLAVSTTLESCVISRSRSHDFIGSIDSSFQVKVGTKSHRFTDAAFVPLTGSVLDGGCRPYRRRCTRSSRSS